MPHDKPQLSAPFAFWGWRMKVNRDPVRRRAWWLWRKLCAKQHVKNIRTVTVCRQCGAQPIDFHRDEHVQHPTWRVSNLAGGGAPIRRIDAEIELCVPLCRKCHMDLDGRLADLPRLAPRRILPPKPCEKCGQPAKPLRNGLCVRCDSRRRNPPRYTPEQRREIRAALVRERNKEPWMRAAVSASKLGKPRNKQVVGSGR